ncbi:MAG: TolC family protein [Polyangia bacterium]
MRTKPLVLGAAAALGLAVSPSGASAQPASPGPASAARAPRDQAPRPLSLSDALEQALRTEPQLESVRMSRARSDLAVLRAQLDRFSLRVDAFVTEQYRATNLGGAAPSPSCATIAPTQPLLGGGQLYTPLQLLSLSSGQLGAPTSAECAQVMGQYIAPDAVQAGALGQFNLSADLRVPLFTGFRISANVARSQLSRDAASASVQQTERQVALDALRAYWGVRRIELQLAVSENALGRYDEAVAVVAARVKNGLAPQVDLNRIEARRQSELSRRADLLGLAAEARAQLAVALGLGGQPLQLTEPAELPPPPQGGPDEVDRLLDEARSERPELRVAHLTSEAAAQSVRMALSGYYPQVSLSGLLQFSNNPFNPLIGARNANSSANPFENITGSVFVGGTVSINLFDTLNTYTAVRDARLEHRRLLAEERRVGRLVESDVRVLHARLVKLYSTREPLLRSREIARDNLSILERRYKSGDVVILDLIDAAVELITAEINLTNQAATIAQTWGELYLAAGRLVPAPR